MSTQEHRSSAVSIPAESRIAKAYASTNLADAYSIDLPRGSSTDPEVLARFIFAQQPSWVGGLMAVRDAVVGKLGLKTAKQLTTPGAAGKPADRVGIFRVYGKTPIEVVLGEDDKHLDFRVSVLCSHPPSPGGERRLTVSTVVHCHNRLGRLYILLIAPFHRLVVRSSLDRAARMGWPRAAAA
jgi:hypothetical protein